MKKEHTRFITGLLSNPKLSLAQRDKVVELALRDLGKNGSDEKILQELKIIKNSLGITENQKNGEEVANGSYTQEDLNKFQGNSLKEYKERNEDSEKAAFRQEEMSEADSSKERKGLSTWNFSSLKGNERELLSRNLNNKDYKAFTDKYENGTVINGEIVKKPTKTTLASSVEPKYIDPKHLSQFLIKYNQDPVLKYTCHQIDDEKIIADINEICGVSEYDLSKHQEIILESYKALEEAFFVNHRIKNLILVYLTGNSFTGKHTTWSTEKIRINWQSRELFEWGTTNPGIVPNPGDNLINKTRNRGFKFKKAVISELSGERITSFSGLVIHFKNLFHIKGDNPLKEILIRVNQKEQWDKSIDFLMDHEDFWENLELFTDVDTFIQAYKALIRIILDAVEKFKKQKPLIKLMFKEEGHNVIFSIHHINSVYGKTVNNTLDRIGDSQTLLIKNQINGLCDLFLKADFDNNQYAEINLWNGEERQVVEIEKFKGVQYILKFKK